APNVLDVNTITNKIYVNNSSYVVTMIDGATNTATTLGGALIFSSAVAVNPVTNKVYVAGQGSCICGGIVTVIDGATNVTTDVNVGQDPTAMVVNPVTNKIYVASQGYPGWPFPSNVTVIDGATNATTTVNVAYVTAMAVNPVTNKIYMTNGNTVL